MHCDACCILLFFVIICNSSGTQHLKIRLILLSSKFWIYFGKSLVGRTRVINNSLSFTFNRDQVTKGSQPVSYDDGRWPQTFLEFLLLGRV